MDLMTRRRSLLKEAGGVTPGGPWEELFASINNSTYATDYAIGDLIPLDLGTEGQINMQIVAFDADALADETGTAPVTLISKELLATSHRMNPSLEGTSGSYVVGTGTIRGWWESDMRSYTNDTIMPLIPSAIANRIVSVRKYSFDYDTNGSTTSNRITSDKVWIPSEREIFGGTNRETQGPAYSDVFNSAAMRTKMKVNASSAVQWWLRSAHSSANFRCVNSSGAVNNNGAAFERGIALGFCVG